MELYLAEYVHTVVECSKLAFADREAFYGDPDFVDVPIERLLSPSYADERRRLVAETASLELRPGEGGRLPPRVSGAAELAGAGEPTRGDTVHLDAVDRHGNVVSATPSGGWLQSSPVVPGVGFPLGTRAQMFWSTRRSSPSAALTTTVDGSVEVRLATTVRHLRPTGIPRRRAV